MIENHGRVFYVYPKSSIAGSAAAALGWLSPKQTVGGAVPVPFVRAGKDRGRKSTAVQ